MPDWKLYIRKYLDGCEIPAGRETDVVEELSQHLELRYQEAVRAGMDPATAERTIANELGGDELRTEVQRIACRSTAQSRVTQAPDGRSWAASLAYDLRYALRGLRLAPVFTAAALLSLALGIGANTAIFQIFDALRLRPLPIHNPQELVEIRLTEMRGARGAFYASRPVMTDPQWELLRRQSLGVGGLFVWYRDEFNVSASGEAHLIEGIEVSGGYFSSLGVQPAIGRLIGMSDDTPGCGNPAVVLSHRYWKTAFAGETNIVGRQLTLEKHAFQVIGVAPAEFSGLEVGRGFDVAVPMCSEPMLMGEYNRLNSGRDWWLTVMGRLESGTSIEQLNSLLLSLSPGLFNSTLPPNYPGEAVQAYRDSKLGAYSAASGVSELRRDYSGPLSFLLCIAVLVMLIACANLANLLLVRAAIREREFSIRLALGASRSRLIRQLLAEGALLAVGGGLLGMCLAPLLSHYLVSFLRTRSAAAFLDVRPDYRVLLFTIVLTTLTCLLFALMPAIRGSQADPGAALKSSGRGLVGQRHRFRIRKLLAATQMALSTVLVIAAMLFTKSVVNLFQVDAGFDQQGLLLANLDLSAAKLPKEQRLAFRRALVEKLKAEPGIENAAETVIRPLSGGGWDDAVWMETRGRSDEKDCWFNRVGPEFFATMRIPLVSGRTFRMTDTPKSPQVAIVNQSFVRVHLGSEEPLGKIVNVGSTPSSPQRRYEIIGVVRDAKYRSLKEDSLPQIYLATSQDDDPSSFTHILVRSNLGTAESIRETNRALSAAAPQSTILYRDLRKEVRDGLMRERLMATLSLMFGILATLLATIGLYGVLSYMLARRVNEIGIRMALGAGRPTVLRLILNEAASLVGFGLIVGIALALLLGRLVSALLFGMTAHDPMAIFMGSALLAGIAMAAAAVPAIRATRLDPMAALRQD
jgi:predicted permease